MGFGELINVFREHTRAFQQVAVGRLRGVSKKSLLIAAFAVPLCAGLTIVITVGIIRARAEPKPDPSAVIFKPDVINDTDIFLPNEPDFLPPVIYEQPRKKSWAEEDAAPFWTDPRTLDDTLWRENISSHIDALLERVP